LIGFAAGSQSAKRGGFEKRIYIIGKMRGIAGYNRPAFDRAALAVIERGDIPTTPVQMDVAAGVPIEVFDPERTDIDWRHFPPGFDFAACRARCIAAVEAADELLALDGWTDSYGAMCEASHAFWAGIPVRDQRGRVLVGITVKMAVAR
jgi:hypothetical protein